MPNLSFRSAFSTTAFVVLSASLQQFAYAIPLVESEAGIFNQLSIPEVESTFAMPSQEDLAQALRLLNGGKIDEAIKLARATLRNNPRSAPAHEILGAALSMKGQIDQGLKHLHKAIEIKPAQSTAYTKIGDIHFARGEQTKAKEYFQKAQKINPEDRRNYQRLGIIYEQEGDIDNAILNYKNGLKGAPGNYLGIKVNLANLYNKTGQPLAAKKLLEGSVKRDSKNSWAHIVLGTSYLRLGQIKKAEDEFNIARKLEPGSGKGDLALGVAYREQNDLDKSRRILEQVVKLKPDWPSGYFQLGITLVQLEKYALATEQFRRAAKLGYPSEAVDLRIATTYQAQGEWTKAAPIYQKLLARKDADPSLIATIGEAYKLAGDFGLAEEAFRRLIQSYPSNPLGAYKLGLLQAGQMKYREAIKSLRQADRLAPNDARILKALSLVYSRTGDKDTAIRYAEKLVANFPDDTKGRFYLATLYDSNADYSKAEQIYREILDRHPTHVGAMNNLSVLLSTNFPANKSKQEEALQLAQKALSLEPDNAVVFDTLGWIQHKRGNQKEALELLKKAAQKRPDNPTVLFHLASTQYSLRMKKAAKENLEKALKISNDFPEAASARTLLDKLTR